MSRFARFYVAILGFTIGCAILAKFFGRFVDDHGHGFPATAIARVLGNEREMQPLSEDMRLQETFENVEIQWALGDVKVVPLPDGETSPRIRYEGKMPKGADTKELFGYRVDDRTLKIKSGENGWNFGFEFGENSFGVTKPELSLLVELPKTWRGSVEIKTVSGDVKLGFFGLDELKVKTIGGDFQSDWRLTAKEVELNSVSGDAKIFGTFGKVRAESVSGDLHLGLPPENQYRVETKSVSGGVQNTLPPPTGKGTPVEVTLKTVSGDIIIAPMSKNPEHTI